MDERSYRIRVDSELKSKCIDQLTPTSLLQQTAFWGKFKGRLGWEARAFDLPRAEQNGDLLVTLRSIGREAWMAYVPYGPEIAPPEDDRGAFLEELSENLRPLLPKECLFVRWDLPWVSPYAMDSSLFYDDGRWMGRPDSRVREVRMNFGTLNRSLRKAPSDTLPADTRILDLAQDEKALLKSMRPKTRYNIRLAGRRGVKVRRGGPEDLEIWRGLYSETAERNGIRSHGMEHFEALFEVHPLHVEGAGRVRLYVAEIDGPSRPLPLAAIFVAFSGKRAVYLYGASSSTRRDAMAPYALQWMAMKEAREEGCDEYDLFGCAPGPEPEHPMYGLYRFKVGFGGSFLHRQGCWDYPFLAQGYEQFRAVELVDPGYYAKT